MNLYVETKLNSPISEELTPKMKFLRHNADPFHSREPFWLLTDDDINTDVHTVCFALLGLVPPLPL